ncbi:hypothetical protein COCC4DRAFT_68261 [Bipolaris maydis ATCC 48331]|uniref:Uncharacterized protein n=2 Tax=Cochliobolus heterostrophus TaxID=5016 RepID=M2U844_COCH5|nr:uncharacterized protein COCC4DRAFT_68261 [Bipolaris maydis ATCC 48331]EMD89921.1 hypothetical protein COCHEDRAFT_1138645 [Bipolaris maydis C5]ENI09867.1 hypothetical protein COCC4DRAFT_68261 [Bipolaris maydis ATCC 48331]
MAIVITMAKYNDREQPEWRYSINLNTIIAVLATVLRSCMVVVAEEVIGQLKWLLFRRPQPLWNLEHLDTAARGPWGSLLLFFRTRSLDAAFVGCMVIILSVGIGPFSQQAVKSVSCERPLAGAEASIRVAQWMAPTNTSRVREYSFKTDLDMDTKVAILDGLVNPNTTRSDIIPSCSTGNSSILNVSIVTFTNHGCELLGPEDGSKFQRCPGADANWTLPIMSYLNAVAVTCSFYSCVRDYAGTVRDTIFTEKVINETPIKPVRITKNSQTYDFKDLHNPCIIDGQTYTRDNISSVPIQGNNFASYFIDGVNTTFPIACIYGLNSDYAQSLGHFIESIMNGNCSTVPKFVPEFYKYEYKSLRCGPWQLEALVNKGLASFDSINRNMQSVATAATSDMRRKGSYYDDPQYKLNPSYITPPIFVTGTVMRTTSCTKFDWVWLSFPLALIVLTTFLLCVACGKMMFDKRRVPVWKSSILPLLLAGHRLRDVAAAEDMDAIKASTERLVVSLVQDERGWEFAIEDFKDEKTREE